MPETVTVKEACTLKAQANLGDEVEEIEFEPGQELTVLKEWENHYLVRNDDGRLFNVEKRLVAA
jgi:hypothetical protein